MIFEALTLLRMELQAYIRLFSTTATVTLGSVASVAGTQADQILISLINVEEESTLKNGNPYRRNDAGGFDLFNPPVFINLYILICANFSDTNTYETALRLLSRTMQCFQHKSQFTTANTPTATSITDPRAAMLQISVDLYPLSFERLNQIWGTLGGKQVPSLVYKVRVIEEIADGQLGSSPAIQSIEGRTKDVNTLSD